MRRRGDEWADRISDKTDDGLTRSVEIGDEHGDLAASPPPSIPVRYQRRHRRCRLPFRECDPLRLQEGKETVVERRSCSHGGSAD